MPCGLLKNQVLVTWFGSKDLEAVPQCGQNSAGCSAWFLLLPVVGPDFGTLSCRGEEEIVAAGSPLFLDPVNPKRATSVYCSGSFCSWPGSDFHTCSCRGSEEFLFVQSRPGSSYLGRTGPHLVVCLFHPPSPPRFPGCQLQSVS